MVGAIVRGEISLSGRPPRVLVYSHDSYGLGHLRRCRAIAQSLVTYRQDLSVLIIAGSPLIGSFSFHPNVDFIRVPGVVKLGNESYAAHSPGMSIEDLTAIRSAIILETAKIFEPDIFIVDKEPLGLRGEVAETLALLKRRGKHLVLGLRDVLDDPERLADEWERKRAMPAIEKLYDHIWVYGLPQISDPLEGIRLPDGVARKIVYTGYLRRTVAPSGVDGQQSEEDEDDEPYVLVTTGGGGDGAMLVDWVLRAYEFDPTIEVAAKIVLGPFMGTNQQTGFMERVAHLKRVQAVTFEASIEPLIERAVGVVAMGGYNTFCEILSFDKRALIVPRTQPRAEQYIRASRAAKLGLVQMLEPEDSVDPRRMASALRALLRQPEPSKVHIPGLLDGLSAINAFVDVYLGTPAAARPRLAIVGAEP
jgi:predicted glycosyltransferase